ncbi:hypothetical protein VSK70_12450 [Bacillus sp. WOD8 KX774193]|nr:MULTISPECIES: hypothetical protein [Bacillus]MDA1847227.1 hypothetical protein [Bacillus cereus]MDA1855703.1 hypothetical protein [Bacillus cereus]MDF9485607.1 hypothetical protein [Bacillus cereus]MEC0016600.1 hypothetical protein [Bacillus anthracis]MEC3856755.1 hypothetical protein [Bacillus sp. WOD8 KX774193]
MLRMGESKLSTILAAEAGLNKKRRQIFLSSLLVFVFQRID